MSKWTERRVADLERKVDREVAWIKDEILGIRRELTSELRSLRREVSDLRFKRS
jgi:phage host-nuclease inhibitor protein Gam